MQKTLNKITASVVAKPFRAALIAQQAAERKRVAEAQQQAYAF
jgi:hypothetical protein